MKELRHFTATPLQITLDLNVGQVEICDTL